jgi:hypothetical protein
MPGVRAGNGRRPFDVQVCELSTHRLGLGGLFGLQPFLDPIGPWWKLLIIIEGKKRPLRQYPLQLVFQPSLRGGKAGNPMRELPISLTSTNKVPSVLATPKHTDCIDWFVTSRSTWNAFNSEMGTMKKSRTGFSSRRNHLTWRSGPIVAPQQIWKACQVRITFMTYTQWPTI